MDELYFAEELALWAVDYMPLTYAD